MTRDPATDSAERRARQMVLTMQIITGGLMFGPLIFGAIAVIIAGDAPPQEGPVSLIGMAFFALSLLLYAIVPRFIGRSAVSTVGKDRDAREIGEPTRVDTGPEKRLPFYAAYQTRVIIGFALLESAAFFNLVAYMFEHHWWSLSLAAVPVLIMMAAFPTPRKIDRWAETQRQRVALNQ
ncbi:MAG: hypothetical protein ACREJB_18135 [Planctomycetaceae bacterium]